MKTDEQTNILNKLFSLQRFGIKPGLERTKTLAEQFGNPHEKFPCIHVAGTNGKGSVCSMIASILTSAGYKTGLYTSPHIFDFNERFRINGIQITDEELAELSKIFLPFIESEKFTFFEITTVMAFKYFADQSVDIGVIETGMGGRFDSTNIIKPMISVITKIDLDHQEYLGNSIQEIAKEKAGIIKKGVPCILSKNNEEVINIIKDVSNSLSSKFIYSPEKFGGQILRFDKNLNMFVNLFSSVKSYDNLNISLAGHHQIYNLITAIAAMDEISSLFPVSDINIRDGLYNINKNTRLKFRIEMIRKNPPLIIDTAHNPDSINILKNTLIDCGFDNDWVIIFAAMKDKDIPDMLHFLKKICSILVLPKLITPRAESPEKIRLMAKNLGFKNIKEFKNVKESFNFTESLNKKILITGSFYLAGELSEVEQFKEMLKRF